MLAFRCPNHRCEALLVVPFLLERLRLVSLDQKKLAAGHVALLFDLCSANTLFTTV